MNMKQIIKLFLVLSLVLLASCSTQQRVVYRDCDCNTPTFGFGWNTNPYWGWNRWNSWNYSPYQVIPRYYIYPNRIQPSQPSRYERRQTIGPRPSRIQQNEPIIYERGTSIPQIQRNTQPSRVDNVYPQRSQPSRVQQRQNTPVTTQPTRSRVQNREN
jgi:hypothetical protein